MDPAHLLRAARRAGGLSQRALADKAGVARATVTAVESGRHGISVAVLDRLLAAVGLDAGLVPRIDDEASAELRRHLRLSLTQRLRLALGESPSVHAPGKTASWRDLVALAGKQRVVLQDAAAVAIWLPIGVVDPLSVKTFQGSGSPTCCCTPTLQPMTPTVDDLRTATRTSTTRNGGSS